MNVPMDFPLKAIERAVAWRDQHPNYVKSLITCAPVNHTGKRVTVAPSGEDRSDPRLWKDIHWAWLQEISPFLY